MNYIMYSYKVETVTTINTIKKDFIVASQVTVTVCYPIIATNTTFQILKSKTTNCGILLRTQKQQNTLSTEISS